MPTSTDRFKRPTHRALILGHRGARREAPENTLLAFDRARHGGADGVDLDVQSSADDVPVVIHDFDLRRVTDGRDERFVRSLSAAELEQVDLGQGQSPPRLDRVLDWAEQHSMLLNVELKTQNARRDPVALSVAELLRERPQLAKQVLVSSFHPVLLSRFRQALPEVPIGFLFTREHLRWATLARALSAEAVHPDARCFQTGAFVFRPASMLINSWTVNDTALARLLNDRGVDAIISDVPGEILAALAPSLLENPTPDEADSPAAQVLAD
jgi:glycerophosphoryl diester phosphodiesterase